MAYLHSTFEDHNTPDICCTDVVGGEERLSRLEFPHRLDLVKERLKLVVINLDETVKDI